MKRIIELKFICLSLLIAGVGMFIAACSSEDDDSERPDTRGEENVVSDADSVVLDPLKVFDDYKQVIERFEKSEKSKWKETTSQKFKKKTSYFGNKSLEEVIGEYDA